MSLSAEEIYTPSSTGTILSDSTDKMNENIVASTIECGLYQRMCSKELNYELYNPDHPFCVYYRDIAYNMQQICDYFSYSISTLMSAAQYYIRASQLLDIPKSSYNALAVVCVILSAKYNERMCRIPTYNELIQSIPGEFSSSSYLCNLELDVLFVLEWRLEIVSISHFVSLYQASGIFQENDLLEFVEPGVVNLSFACISRTVLYNLLPCYSVYSVRPSLMAAAVIAFSRSMVHLCIWNEELEAITGYSLQQIKPWICFIESKCGELVTLE